MKATTECVLAIRNVGDSGDKGRTFTGPLREIILEVAKYLAAHDMKTRFQFAVARSTSDALAGIRIKGDASPADQSLMDDLESILAGAGEESAERAVTEPTGEEPWTPVFEKVK